MKKTRIIFFGTPDFAVRCLDFLYTEGYDIIAVVTAPDRKAGRGKKMITSAVKQYAASKALKILQPTNLKDPDFIAALTELNPDIHIVVAFRMLPESVWQLPPLGTINLHASLLPNYRGAAPINWALINNEKITGVTTFLIDREIDTGMLLLQKEIAIQKEDDFGTLHDKLVGIGAPLISETIKGLVDQTIIPIAQKRIGSEFKAPKLNTENTKIRWEEGIEKNVAQIRGLSPYPGAWTLFQNEGEVFRMKIFKATGEYCYHSFPLNRIIVSDKKLKIARSEGFLICEVIQLPNKKRMDSSALLNGYKFSSEAKIMV